MKSARSKSAAVPANFGARLLTLRLMVGELGDALPTAAASLRREIKAELDDMIRECRPTL